MEPSFPQFHLLPAELRSKVWRFAIPCRIIPVKLKMDLDTWNAATEEDSLLTHYRVVYDGQVPQLPSVGLVNREAHHEIMRHYKPIRLDRDAVKRALGYEEVDDMAINTIKTMCNSSRISLFDPERDVLEWRAPQHWIIPNYETLRPLFVAACLSVRHVSIHFQASLQSHLDIIASAVFDQDQPLETLTITMGDTHERGSRYRLARCPSESEALRPDFVDIQRILSQYSA
ncbi:hypothetical protein F5Y06DRAFT_272814 [Hypoxylon sp. FL0890]|nr:hypothetical protein F5Y06DRAFT_272814 [Hypoxylon sp. FL0890]